MKAMRRELSRAPGPGEDTEDGPHRALEGFAVKGFREAAAARRVDLPGIGPLSYRILKQGCG